MKLYKYRLGNNEHISVADDMEDAYNKRSELDPIYEFTPVEITEINVEGYDISVAPAQMTIDDIKPPRKKKEAANG